MASTGGKNTRIPIPKREGSYTSTTPKRESTSAPNSGSKTETSASSVQTDAQVQSKLKVRCSK